MPHRTFLTFIWPSALAMLLFIALPVLSVGIQSLHIEHEQIVQTVKNCGPFGCKEVDIVDAEATALLQKEQPHLAASMALAHMPTAITLPLKRFLRHGRQVAGLAVLSIRC